MSSQEEQVDPKPSFTTSQAAVQITRDNVSWSHEPGQGLTGLTYGFRSTRPQDGYANDDGKTFSRVNEQQREASIKAVTAWADVANITFAAVDPTGFTDDATILIANFEAGVASKSAAHAYAPSTKNFAFDSEEGDFWLNIKSTAQDFDHGTYNYATVLHELGHSLGLDHPGRYAAGDERDANYKDDAVYRQDSLQYTIMSYFEADNTGAVHTVGDTTFYGSTPLLDDIAAIQRLYGANMHTRAGDTIYGFHGTETGSAFDIASPTQEVVLSIWDAGGFNTLDLSGYSSNQVIDLRAGHFSSAGALTDNISIALGTIIHTGIGGAGNDTIFGNDADNALVGNAGDDRLDGGLGFNSASFTGPARNYEITLTAGLSPFTVHDRIGGDGTDTLVAIQDLRFDGQHVTTPDLVLSRSLFSQSDGFFGDASRLFHLYIAEEGRAPDALGLYYWAARIAQGASLSHLADSFFVQPETASVHAPALDDQAFVTAVYHNLFHHAPDRPGLAYWLAELGHGTSRGHLLLSVALGALEDDATIIDNKVAVARRFAQTEGLTNAAWGRDVLADVDATAESVVAADQKIAAYAEMTSTGQAAELVVRLIGVTSEGAAAA